MRKYFAIIIIIMMLPTLISCSLNGADDVSNRKELSIYLTKFDTSTQNAVDKFNKTHSNVQIKVKTIESMSETDLGGKLMYELNNGKGPDIIFCSQETLPNLSIFFSKGMFYDLNTLITKDNTFKLSNYFEKVLDYGKYKDKRYVIPLSFKIDAMFSTKNLLLKNNIDSSSVTGIDNFKNTADKYMSDKINGKRYFVSGLDFGSLLQMSGTQFFNVESKTASFDSKEFGELLDKYKDLSGCASTKELSITDSQNSDMLVGNKVLFQNTGTMGPKYTFMPYSSFKSEIEPVLVPSLSGDNNRHIIAKPENYIGINSKCRNVEAAYDFIKLMLSEKFQDSDITEGIPVNRDAYKQAIDNSIRGMKGYDLWMDSGCCTKKALKLLYAQLDSLVEDIDRCWTTDEYILTIVKNEVDAYLMGNSKKEDTLKNIQGKIENYYTSGFILESASDKDETPADPEKTISLYYWNTGDFPNHSKSEFEKENPGYKVNSKIFNSISDYFNRTAVELMAGGGPDIILFHLRTFNSINKVVKTGVFCEMDDYIKKYDVIKYDEYNKSLLDGGVYKGKRYYIPLYYYGSNLCSTNVLLDENSIKINNSGWTWDEFVDSSKEFMKKNKNNGKYFLSSNYGLYHMMLNWEEPLIDYESQKPNFNSDTFKKLLTVYKELYPAKAPEGSDTKSMIKNKKILFQNGQDNPLTYKYCYEDYQTWNLGDLVLVPTPSLSGKRIENAIPAQGIAINSRCRNKEAAFKFLKIAMSYDMQRYYYKNGETNGNLSMPINNKAFKDDLLSYTTLPKQLVNQAVQAQSITGSSLIKDYNIIDMAKELAADYISGKKTVDQVAKELDDKVNVLLNE